MSFGVIFDWDGVIIHSAALHRKSWHLVAEEEGLQIPQGAFEISFGMRNAQIIPEVFRWAEKGDADRIRSLADRKEALYRQLLRKEGIAPLPGVVELLRRLREAGVPTAVGSSTPRENITTVIDVARLENAFVAIVASEDVRRGKPDPEVFRIAAERLGLPPERCVVVEDAHVGIEAARRGGMKVLAVASTHPAESLSAADRVLPDLRGVAVSDLEALVSGA